MKTIFLASRWAAAALAIGMFAVNGETCFGQKNKSGGGGGNRNSGGGGGGGNRNSGGGGGNRNNGGGSNRINNGGGGNGPKIGGNGPKAGTGNGLKAGTPRIGGNGPKVGNGTGRKLGGNGSGKNGPGKNGGKGNWNHGSKNGWNKDGWNNSFNAMHHNHHHGYWLNGLWIAPWVIAYSQPWEYLEPVQQIVSGQKWLGVTYGPYDGGGAYVTGVYDNSPAQEVGIEVGDVIVGIDGVDATDLGNVVQASNDSVTLQVLAGRTGDLVETPVNLIR